MGRASHLPTVPTLAILASPVYPVVPHKCWLVEDEKCHWGERGVEGTSPEHGLPPSMYQ